MCSNEKQEDTAIEEPALSLVTQQKVRRQTKPLPAKDSANEQRVVTAEEKVSQLMEITEEEMQDFESRAMAAGKMWSSEWTGEEQLLERENRVFPAQAEQSGADFFKLQDKIDQQQLQKQKDLIDEGWHMLIRLSDPEYLASEEAQESDQAWTLRMLQMAPDPKQMKGGSMSDSSEAMKYFLEKTGNASRQAKRVLGWLRHGMRFNFVGTEHVSQEKAPHRKKNIEVVRKLLQRSVGKDRVEECMSGMAPAQVHFANHVSVQQHEDFVEKELEKARAAGVIADWPFEQLPQVINGLKVVEKLGPDGQVEKLRLCISPQYTNAFMAYDRVRYERLLDIVEMVEASDYMSTSDDKAGYWQMAMHPSTWTYLGFMYKGRVQCWKVLPFGVMDGPFKCTSVKQVVYDSIRQTGARLLFMMDDSVRVEKKKKKDFTSFCQLTQPIACGRASATLPNVIHLCQTKCQRPPDRDALSTPYA